MDIHALTLRELALHLAAGELSAVEVVEALHARRDAVDGVTNGFVVEMREAALDEARRADEARARGDALGPLHGVPISIKESIDVRGTPSTLGLAARKDAIAQEDAVAVQLARRAGAIVLGKTNVPQTLLCPMDTTSFLFGTTPNPWNRARGAGGSSGGEAAVIATGQSPFGLGTDVGGSIRVPAAFCGVAGLRPTVHRWSNQGSNTCLVGQDAFRAQIGPMARTAADLAFAMRALSPEAFHARDPQVPPLPIGEVPDVSKLRIGFYTHDGFIEPAGSVQRAVREAATALEASGATVVELAPKQSEEIAYLYFAGMTLDGGVVADRALAGEKAIEPLSISRRIAKMPDGVRKSLAGALRVAGERRVAKLMTTVGTKRGDELWALTAQRDRLRREEARAWDDAGIDAVVCPTHVTTAAPFGMTKDFTIAIAYAIRFNVLNFPAGSVPVTRVRPDETRRELRADRIDKRAAAIEAQSAGLPVGVQVAARPYREDIVLAVMQAIEDRARRERDFPWTPVDP